MPTRVVPSVHVTQQLSFTQLYSAAVNYLLINQKYFYFTNYEYTVAILFVNIYIFKK